jgi:hypothetical protein
LRADRAARAREPALHREDFLQLPVARACEHCLVDQIEPIV